MCVWGGRQFISETPRAPECHVWWVPRVSHGILDKAFCLSVYSVFIVKMMPPEFLTDVPKLFH